MAKHRGYYRVKARRHEAAARAAKSESDREGHREVARGYYRLGHAKAGGRASGRHVRSGLAAAHRRKKHHHKRRRRAANDRFR